MGYAGRLVESKGLRDLMAATRLVPGIDLVIAGDGPMAEEVRREPNVRWLGTLDRTRMAEFWGEIDAFVLPSRTTRKWAEQFGRVIVEAMAHGVPVIGSTSGAIPEVIGDAGLVFPEGDVVRLAEAIERLRSDASLRALLSDRGYERLESTYHDDVVMPATVEFYHEILGSSRNVDLETLGDNRCRFAPRRYPIPRGCGTRPVVARLRIDGRPLSSRRSRAGSSGSSSR